MLITGIVLLSMRVNDREIEVEDADSDGVDGALALEATAAADETDPTSDDDVMKELKC